MGGDAENDPDAGEDAGLLHKSRDPEDGLVSGYYPAGRTTSYPSTLTGSGVDDPRSEIGSPRTDAAAAQHPGRNVLSQL